MLVFGSPSHALQYHTFEPMPRFVRLFILSQNDGFCAPLQTVFVLRSNIYACFTTKCLNPNLRSLLPNCFKRHIFLTSTHIHNFFGTCTISTGRMCVPIANNIIERFIAHPSVVNLSGSSFFSAHDFNANHKIAARGSHFIHFIHVKSSKNPCHLLCVKSKIRC